MPEAVASNSTTTPIRNPFQNVQNRLEGIESRLKALTHMIGETFSNFQLEEIGKGTHDLLRKEVNEIYYARKDLENEFEDLIRQQTFNPSTKQEISERIGRIVADAYCNSGREMALEDMADWSNLDSRAYTHSCLHYYKELTAKLEGETHLLEVGSLLPWLEMKIRNEISNEVKFKTSPHSDLRPASSEPRDLRDQFIMEKLKDGYSLSHISQALNVRVSAIEKAIQRLTGKTLEEKQFKAA